MINWILSKLGICRRHGIRRIWCGSDGDPNKPGNWTPYGVPGPDDTAVIYSGHIDGGTLRARNLIVFGGSIGNTGKDIGFGFISPLLQGVRAANESRRANGFDPEPITNPGHVSDGSTTS
jgi:hypothetical protein